MREERLSEKLEEAVAWRVANSYPIVEHRGLVHDKEKGVWYGDDVTNVGILVLGLEQTIDIYEHSQDLGGAGDEIYYMTNLLSFLDELIQIDVDVYVDGKLFWEKED